MKKIIICLLVLSINLCGCSINDESEGQEIVTDSELNNIESSNSVEEDTKESMLELLDEERIIQTQSFSIKLDDWGTIEFISYEPDPSVSFEDVSFFLAKDNQIIYEFPDYCENNNTINYVGLFDSVEAVGFRDMNNDGKNDIVIIINYITGAEPQGMVSRSTIRIFLAGEKEFYLAEDMMIDISNNIEESDLTIDEIYSFVLDKGLEKSVSKINEKWEEEYKNIICNIRSNLVDPYNLRLGSNEYVYLGIHDFDDDDIPELIIGDNVSVALFTYENGEIKKIADLYEPEEWGGINGLYYKDNNIVLVSNGSDGSSYVCFTYDQGEYIIGVYDEYNLDKATINEKQVTGEEFKRQFNLTELLKNSNVAYNQIVNEDKITLVIKNKRIMIDNLDFSLIEW